MINFAPTQEQEEIRELALSLAIEQLRPRGREADRNAEVPSDLLRTLAQTGLTTPFPEEFGGSGSLEAMAYTMIAEELGFGDGALALHIIGSLMGPVAVLLAGNPAQQHKYLPPFCDAERGHTCFGSLAFAERSGGYTLDEISATVRREADTFVLNGIKRDVIHGTGASPRVVLARLEGSSGLDALCTLVIPNDAPGIQIIPETNKLGLHAVPTATLLFEEAQLAPGCLLDQAGSLGIVRAATLYQILRGAVACGTARAGLEYAQDYARQRMAFGRSIVSYQGIAFLFSEMAMKLDAARLYLWRAAASWDKVTDLARELVSLVREAEAAQYQALKIAKSATIDTVQILGGAGFMQDHPAEMWMRNAAAME